MQRRRTTDDPHCSLVGQDGRGARYGSLSEEAIEIPQVGGCSLSPSQSSCLGNRCSHRRVCLTSSPATQPWTRRAQPMSSVMAVRG